MEKVVKFIVALPINEAYTLPDGVKYISTDCQNYEQFKILPKGIEYDGNKYGLSCWDSDKYIACYRTDKPFAKII